MTPKIILDTRNQKDGFVQEALEKMGYSCLRSKLPFGDVALSTNILRCVDLKSSGGGLIEVAKNFCSQDHARVRNEILNCFAADGEITFLCFEPNMTSIEDIPSWQVPTYKTDGWQKKYYVGGRWLTEKQAVQKGADLARAHSVIVNTHRAGTPMSKVAPMTLYKAIKTITTPDRYVAGKTVHFEFATKENCGQRIIEILTR